jgi:hypothetical protein
MRRPLHIIQILSFYYAKVPENPFDRKNCENAVIIDRRRQQSDRNKATPQEPKLPRGISRLPADGSAAATPATSIPDPTTTPVATATHRIPSLP